jgi:hypothetical protein
MDRFNILDEFDMDMAALMGVSPARLQSRAKLAPSGVGRSPYLIFAGVASLCGLAVVAVILRAEMHPDVGRPRPATAVSAAVIEQANAHPDISTPSAAPPPQSMTEASRAGSAWPAVDEGRPLRPSPNIGARKRQWRRAATKEDAEGLAGVNGRRDHNQRQALEALGLLYSQTR